MKISDKTFELLKNYSAINKSLKVAAGNTLSTIAEQENIIATASVEEKFPKDFAIWDLSQFLGLFSLFRQGEIEFKKDHMILSSGATKAKYVYADPGMVTTAPAEGVKIDDYEVETEITKDDLKKLLNGANQLNLEEIYIRSESGSTSIEAAAVNPKNPTSNEFIVHLGDKAPKDSRFNFIVRVENIKFIPNDYTVSLALQVLKFAAKDGSVQYWVAPEDKSKYEAKA